MKLTIGIKAYNEEKHIADALASAVAAARPFGGEVILADCGSTDRTIEIARGFPVRIVQLANRDERSCGAGAQLAFQDAKGEYFYLLDGDMLLDPRFIEEGIAFLEQHEEFAGVGGRVREMNTDNAEFKIRAATVRNDRNWLPGEVDRLDCGGLYRSEAIRQVGYFADRNLHAFEEFELAARLRSKGWRLVRIDCPAVEHYGHTLSGYALLWKRIRSGYAGASGEVLRGAIGSDHLSNVLDGLHHIRNGALVLIWWTIIIASVALDYQFVSFSLLFLPLAGLSYRRGSFTLGVYSMVSWNSIGFGLVSGFFRRRISPNKPLETVDIRSDWSDVRAVGGEVSTILGK